MKQCVWCSSYFEPTVSYQVYCGGKCRGEATRLKIQERSRLASIKRRSKKKRLCANGCGTVLSIYNDSRICNACSVNNKLVDKAIKNISQFFDIEDFT